MSKNDKQTTKQNHPMLDKLPVSALLVNTKGQVVYANQRAQEQLGLFIGHDIIRYFEKPEQYSQALEKITRLGFIENIEFSALADDGNQLCVSVSARVIEYEGQSVFLASVIDISQTKKAQQELLITQQNQEKLINSLPDVLMRFDREIRHLYVSKNIESFASIPASDFIGKTHEELGYPKEQAKYWEETIQTVFKSKTPHTTEISFQGPTGEITFDWRLIPEFNQKGKVESVFSISRDITTQRQAERNYTRLFNQMQEGFALHEIILDEQGQPIDYSFLAVNPAFERLTNLKAKNIIGKTVLQALPQTEKYWIETYGKVALTGEPITFENYSAALQKYYLVHAFRYAPGQFAVVFSDMTEQKNSEQKLTRQAARIHALYRIQQAIVSSMELEEVLQILATVVVEQLQVDATAVLVLNPETNTLDFAANQGFRKSNALQFTRLPLGDGLAGRAAQERIIIHSANLKESPVLGKALEHEDFVTYYGIPLIVNDTLHGVLEILHRSSLSPDPEWLDFLDLLADQAAISIDNARMLQLTRQNLKEANALYRINQDLLATIAPIELMSNVVELLKSSFGYYHAQIYVAEPGTGDFVVRAASGEIGKKILRDGYRLAAGEGIVGFTADTDKPFFTNNVENSISFVRSPYLPETISELAVPIKIGADFLGLIDIHQDKSFPLTERDLKLVSAIADQLALALQKASLYSDLQDALSQEQAMRAQLIRAEKLTIAGKLLASVSHELNNPIQAIQNALFLLKEEKGISPQGKQDLEIVLSETERMASMLQRLRVTYQPLDPVDFKPVQINELIEDVFALLSTHLRQHQIVFEFHAYPELPPVWGITDQFRQVVLNLFLNAVDAMPQGGQLTIATQYMSADKQVLITISDTGPGIEQDIFPNIFDAFITNKSGGTGLGLTISNEIVQKHGGSISAQNNLEAGATFEVWLPIKQGEEK
jgi:PAS domain S-box-containing protein